MKVSFAFAAVLAVVSSGGAAVAAPALKVCSADDDLPFANRAGDGFEDRLAQSLARHMGTAVERVGFTDPRYVVRDLLNPGQCDVMMGVDAGDPRLETTRSYYDAPYVFVSRRKDGLKLTDWNSNALKDARIGVVPGTPAETMLREIGRHSDNFPYLMSLGGYGPTRNRYVRYDTRKLVEDVANGTIDVAVAWLPSVGRYLKAHGNVLSVTPVPDSVRRESGEEVRFRYPTSIGVRKGDTALRDRIQSVLDQDRKEIQSILGDEGITRKPSSGKRARAAATPRREATFGHAAQAGSGEQNAHTQ